MGMVERWGKLYLPHGSCILDKSDRGERLNETHIEFFAEGTPVARGSAKHMDWWMAVRNAANKAAPKQPWAGSVEAAMLFVVPKPKGDPKKYLYPDRRPDLHMLVESVLDAISRPNGNVVEDDSQICFKLTGKVYQDEKEERRCGVRVRMYRIPPGHWSKLQKLGSSEVKS